jgi:hypothetical protein
MTNSFPNFFHIAEHMLIVCLLESGSLFQSDDRSEDDKKN